ncbi:hypothetical protein [Herpetosiphon sp. NSE202]|uniref:hypothetical protein n=1 Tax=Herpetosiphon sp. NSE202 TaxID=3351349 RepID=UPI00363CEA6B
MKPQPLAVLKDLEQGRIGLRFEKISQKEQFAQLLKLFRQAFPLATSHWIGEQYWWILQESQIPFIYGFANQYGLKVQKEV